MSELTDDQLRAVLDMDPLGVAEELTGTSYKEDEPTTWLGFAIMQDKRKVVDAALLARNDTLFSNDLDRYEQIILGYGFRPVLAVPFKGRAYQGEAAPDEHLFVYFHDALGLVLVFDTYQGVRVNGGSVYYGWRPDPETDWYRYTSSHDGYCDGVLVGHHDCREALIFNLENLRTHGEFLTPWPRDGRVWLAHRADDLDSNGPGFMERCDAIRNERMALLPADVLAVIQPTREVVDEADS